MKDESPRGGPRKTFSAFATSWPDAIRDVVLIVLSILIAFTLDAWWDGRQTRREEARILHDLEREFVGAKTEFERAREVHLSRREAGRALQSLILRRATLSSDSLHALWWTTLRRTTFDPPQGVLSGLIASGKLQVIRDDTLVRQLAGWSAVVENLAQTEENLRIMSRDQVLPWLQLQTPFPPADSMTSAFPVDLRPLLNSFVFENMVRMLVRQTESILRDAEPVATQIDSILDRTRRIRAFTR